MIEPELLVRCITESTSEVFSTMFNMAIHYEGPASDAHTADTGEMMLSGEPYTPRNPLQARKAGVAMIYQELSIAPHLSVMENILLGVEPGKGPMIGWHEMRERAKRAKREDFLTFLEASPDVPPMPGHELPEGSERPL